LRILKKQPFLFVTVGSTDFDDLVQAVDTLVPGLSIQGIMQIGHGRYEPINLPFFRFAPSLEPYYSKASFAIAHGGLATTMEILRKRIPLISVSNSDRYDDHQEDLLSTMADEGYLIWCRRLDKLKQAIETALKTSFRRYQPPACKIHLIINEFLNSQARNH
jgi:UDP-N-acetylglucosamine transferase subunit ALG13